jgi:prepilin-type N-terminal cleavage/methylation domain-containing protein
MNVRYPAAVHRTAAAGFTLVELLIVMAVVGVILSIAVVAYRHARIVGHEAVALTTLRTINEAQFSYKQTCGNQRYAPTLANLGVAPPGSDSAFLSPDLTVGDPLRKSGYLYQLSGTEVTDIGQTCTGVNPLETYKLTADPIAPGVDGDHFYGTNTDRFIYQDIETFAGNMPETGSPGHGSEIK